MICTRYTGKILRWSFPRQLEPQGEALKALFEVRDGDNLENFKGKVTKADSYSLTVENISIDNIKSLNLPDKDGKITVNNISYSYDSWEAQVDAQGRSSCI